MGLTLEIGADVVVTAHRTTKITIDAPHEVPITRERKAVPIDKLPKEEIWADVEAMRRDRETAAEIERLLRTTAKMFGGMFELAGGIKETIRQLTEAVKWYRKHEAAIRTITPSLLPEIITEIATKGSRACGFSISTAVPACLIDRKFLTVNRIGNIAKISDGLPPLAR